VRFESVQIRSAGDCRINDPHQTLSRSVRRMLDEDRARQRVDAYCSHTWLFQERELDSLRNAVVAAQSLMPDANASCNGIVDHAGPDEAARADHIHVRQELLNVGRGLGALSRQFVTIG
jgi:hypothetical protein